LEKGLMCLVLHAHLPFVRHPAGEEMLEERWLYEGITETYVPLLQMMEGLLTDNVDFRVTISLSPPLISMLQDKLIMEKYQRHLDNLISLSNLEVMRTEAMPEFNYTAGLYRNRFRSINEFVFKKYGGNILPAFRQLADSGKIQLITSMATHGFLPLISHQEEIIRAQVSVAVNLFQQVFGRKPPGIWLPECGYKPGIDYILKEFGLRYFFTDTHGIMYASRRPKYGIYAPIYCPSGVAAFGRDTETSRQVWSSQEGYPGDPDYREFYRDIGYDLEYDYIKDYLPQGIRVDTGLKYHRITGPTGEKAPYQPEWAREKAILHAGNFMFNRQSQLEYLAEYMDRKPLIVAPYDAELFGHWWFEGPDFLNYFFRKSAFDQDTFRLIHPSQYLEMYPVNQVAVPNASSWGHKGYNEVWLEESNEWIYRHLHLAGQRMIQLASNNHHIPSIKSRALNQAARELLLAQSSDWAFIMRSGTMVDYAVRRTKEHLHNFTRLFYAINEDLYDEAWLQNLEKDHNIFPNMDYRCFAR